jgi:hypothetical protein
LDHSGHEGDERHAAGDEHGQAPALEPRRAPPRARRAAPRPRTPWRPAGAGRRGGAAHAWPR